MSVDSVTSPDPNINKITGTEGDRPEPGDTYFLATGSKRINGYRFVWGDALPDGEGKRLYDEGQAVKGAENLRDELGNRLPVPYLRTDNLFTREPQPEVTDADGVHTPDSGRASVTDSQAGQRTEQHEAQKPARSARK